MKDLGIKAPGTRSIHELLISGPWRLPMQSAARKLALGLWLALPWVAQAQPRPYIGFVYPAGGQQGTTFQIRLGGQSIETMESALVTGSGVTARIVDNYRRLNNQELQLLNEQASVLRRGTLSDSSRTMLMQADNSTMMSQAGTNQPSGTNEMASTQSQKEAALKLIEAIEKRTREFVQTPACAAIASLALVEVTIAPDAQPGEREIRLATSRGVSNPLAFHVGQLAERSRKPMVTAVQQVLGKEAQALRKRLPGDEEDRISLPSTVNGQMASGEVHQYSFEARRGQRLVISTLGRALVPFIADAVPGWFQPVLALYDSGGKEVAYDDDYRFKPDPTILYEVPKDGEYTFTIRDGLYRGREDFVYRITIGEMPFISSLFPLGAPASAPIKPEIRGWNLEGAELSSLPANAQPGVYSLTAKRKGFVSNPMPFALDKLPEVLEQEPNNTPATAQKVTLPVIINGRIDNPDDRDVYEFEGRSNDLVVAEIRARRLDSPLDSVLRLTDATGKLLAFNDDREDPGAGLNTHHADSYLLVRLPVDGAYYVHIGDTARQGGEEYSYRLRISPPQPDFELRVVPSSLSLKSNSSGALTVYAERKDGFAGPIKLGLRDAPPGFAAAPAILTATQTVGRLNLKTSLTATHEPVALTVFGSGKAGEQDISHSAVPAEDRMQAFLWRQLVPAKDLQVMVFDPGYQPPPKRIAPPRPPHVADTNSPILTNVVVGTNTVVGTKVPAGTNSAAGTNLLAAAATKPKFTKQQVAGRLRQLKLLFEEGMFTTEFYNEKVAECEAAE